MIVRNGQPFNIDQAWTDENGIQYPANWYRLASDEERSEKGFSWADDPPSFDERYYYDANTPKPVDQIRQTIKNQLAAIRWGKETSGIIYNSNVYATDDASRVNYLGAIQTVTDTINWKAKDIDGNAVFVSLTKTDLQTIMGKGIAYISACFDHEKNICETIDTTETVEELIAIDLHDGWPDRNA